MSRKRRMTIEVAGDVRDGQRKLDGLNVTVDETSGAFDGMADKVATGYAAIAGVQTIAGAVGSLNDMGLAAELAGNKAETVFGPALQDMQRWADDLNESLGVTDLELLGMGANMADLLKPMGFTAEQSAEMTQEMLDLSGALSAWSGGSRDAAEVSEILSAAMLGERDSLKSLGISINQAEVDQRALTIAQADGRDSITQMDQAMATQQLVLEKSTDAQQAWADGTMDSVKANNEMAATIAEAKESIAEAFFPALSAATAFIVSDAIPAVQQLSGFLVENKELFIAAGIGITTMLVPAFTAWAVSAGAAAVATLVAAAPVILLGLAVGALAAGVIWAYQNVDWFRESVDFLADFLINTAAPAAIAFGEDVGRAAEIAWAVAGPYLENIADSIRTIVNLWERVAGIDFGSVSSAAAGAGPAGSAFDAAKSFLGFHSGGTFHSGRGGEGPAWLQDGEKIYTPAASRAHSGADSFVLELTIGDETITRSVERVGERRRIRVNTA